MPARALAGTALAVLGCALGACGETAPALSPAQLEARANAICKRGTARVEALGPPPEDFLANPSTAIAYLDAAVPIGDDVVSELRALHPDGAAAPTWSRFVDDARSAAAHLDAARAKAQHGDPSGIQDFELATGPLRQALDASARAAGAVECAR